MIRKSEDLPGMTVQAIPWKRMLHRYEEKQGLPGSSFDSGIFFARILVEHIADQHVKGDFYCSEGIHFSSTGINARAFLGQALNSFWDTK